MTYKIFEFFHCTVHHYLLFPFLNNKGKDSSDKFCGNYYQ